MLLERLRPIVDEVLRRNQAGFRRSRSTVDQIYALRRIFEGVAYKKIPLVATFVDFKKAFDSVNRARLFEIMQLYGIPDKLIDAVKKLYNGSKAVVAVNGKISESFEVTSGVLQGDVLAPFLFILVMDYVLMRSEEQYGFEYRQASGSRSRRIPARRINDLDFADDIVLLENCIQIANQQLESLRSEAARVGLVINEKKTEVMTFNIDQASSNLGGSGVHLSGVELARVDNFRYLGSMMKSTTSDFEYRRGLAWSAFRNMERIWKAEHLDLALKLRIFQASVLSVLINTVYKPPLINTVYKRQLGWLGHVLRRDEREPARIFALYTPEHGKPKAGKPPLTYLKQTARLLSSNPEQVTADHIAKWANSKKEWHDRTAAYLGEATID